MLACISAESHLSKLGYTVPQARDFISSNILDARTIFQVAFDNAVTIDMLSEITAFSTDQISKYFSDAKLLDPSLPDPSSLDATSILVNSELGTLENLVNFNNNTGILSTTTLEEKVKPEIVNPFEPNYYDVFFEPLFPFQPNDGIYDCDELGVKNLSNVAATDENLKSLFYGTLVNIFSRVDNNELDQINKFSGDKDSGEYQTLLFNALSSSPPTIVWTTEELSGLVVSDAVRIINDHPHFIGILDDSFLGLSAV